MTENIQNFSAILAKLDMTAVEKVNHNNVARLWVAGRTNLNEHGWIKDNNLPNVEGGRYNIHLVILTNASRQFHKGLEALFLRTKYTSLGAPLYSKTIPV